MAAVEPPLASASKVAASGDASLASASKSLGAASRMPGSSYPSNLGLPQRPVGLYSNKATALRDLQHAHRKHVERLRTMKHTIDLTPVKPVKMSAGKKLQNMAERNATIEAARVFAICTLSLLSRFTVAITISSISQSHSALLLPLQRDNKLLLSKMYQIMNADNPYLKAPPHPPTL